MGIRSWVADSALVVGFSRLSSTPPVAGELFAGVEKPSTTLVKMLIAEMVQNIEVEPSACEYIGLGWTSYKVRFPSFALTYAAIKDNWGGSGNAAAQRIDCISLNADPKFTVDRHEIELFTSAIKSWLSLHNSFKANEAENKRQQKAVDLIESLFKPKPEPAAEPSKPMDEPDLSMFDAPKLTIAERKLGL